MAVDTYDRHRYRVHTGSTLELKYALQTFGIPVSALPIDDDGVVSTEYNTEFWKKQRTAERRKIEFDSSAAEAMMTADGGNDTSTIAAIRVDAVRITTPGKHDVLMGRGRSCQEHSGYVTTYCRVVFHKIFAARTNEFFFYLIYFSYSYNAAT
jgi:hypothetical protein